MTLLITGGTGFVMSNLARHWLEANPAATAVVLAAAAWDPTVERFFAPVRDRLTFVQADVLDPAAWERLVDGHDITHSVRGATITPLDSASENAQPRQILEVNIMGTVNALEFARRLPSLRRFIYVSSGAVYGEAVPGTPDVPVTEDGHLAPAEFYGITKFASELITHDYGQPSGLPVIGVRLSGVYGPTDRATPARKVESRVYRLVHLALAGRPLKVKSFEAGGDWIHAQDVARALSALLAAPELKHATYNIAQGEFTTLAEMVEIVRAVVLGLRKWVTPEADADIAQVPSRRLGRWIDYDNSRLRDECGCRPRPIRVALQSYVAWVRENE
jgi:nucleoside-diphosphate-sugar epimerase